MELTEILSITEWSHFEGDVFKRFGMSCTVQDINGARITEKLRWSNRLCRKIKGDKESLAAICSPSNLYFMAEARKTETPVVGECDAGFLKLAVPIIVNGEFLGAVGGCGLLPAGGEIEPFIITKTLGLSEREIFDVCRDIRVMNKTEGRIMAEYIDHSIREFTSAVALKRAACH
jgi:ligand-binding sensor protein